MKIYSILLLALLVACSPSAEAIQAAIIQTQNAMGTATGVVMGEEQTIQTRVAETVSVWGTATAEEFETKNKIGTAIAQTQAFLASPTQAPPTPLPSETSQPSTPTRGPTHTPAPPVITVIPSGPITLTLIENLGENRVRVTWQADGSFVDGFVVVWSKSNGEPAYPDDYWARFGNGAARSSEVTVSSPNNYFFRVCEMHSSGVCNNYSNVFTFDVE